MEIAKPQKEHLWLKQLAGDWTYDFEAQMPDGTTMKTSGTESVRMIGELWAVAEGKGAMPDGTPTTTVLTVGYDADARKYVGTWFGSMMTRLWIYDCSMDASGKVLTMSVEGPSMDGQGTSLYQDIIEITDKDHRTFRSRGQDKDGSWRDFMSMTYTRVS